MTSRRPRVSTFADVYPVLDALIAAGGGFVDCGTPGRAVRWRQRGYQARAAFVRLEEERNANVPGYSVSTPYDGMHLTVVGSRVRLTIIEPVAGLTDLDGTPLSIPKARIPEELQDRSDENEDFVRNLVAKNG